MFRRIISSLIACLFLASLSFAQEISKPTDATMIDEFGEIQLSDLKARLDNGIINLQANPNTKLFVVLYRTKYEPPGKIFRYFKIIKNYTENVRGVEPDKVIMINGEEGNCSVTQLWIVPNGKTPKIEKFYRNSFEDKESVRKFDEFYYPDNDLYYEYWDEDASFKEFSDNIKLEKGATAYVILYSGYENYNKTGKYRDTGQKVLKIQNHIRQKLISKYALLPNRVKVINGGFRETRQVELWIVPRGKHPPIATPNVFPRVKINYSIKYQ